MKENLYQMMKDRDKLFPESSVRNVIYQVLQGLAFMHKHGYFHRDMKPENLLCSGPELVKIADFGLAREIRSRPPYTDYVSTRWYRAPEVLLRSMNYNSPIDIWALGCIMAELYTLRPLYPGSSEIDELFKICAVQGTPSKSDWADGHKLAAAMNFRWPQMVQTPLKQIIPNAGNEGLALLRDMLMWDPQKRPSCQQSLRHNFFRVGQNLGTKQLPSAQQRPSMAPKAVPKSPVQKQERSVWGGGAQQQQQQQQQPYIQPSPKHESVLPQISQAPSKVAPQPAAAAAAAGKKSGRKRWGAGGLGESMDDWDDWDMSMSVSKKAAAASPTRHAPAPVKPSPSVASRKKKDDDDDDFFSSTFGSSRKQPLKPVVTNTNNYNARKKSIFDDDEEFFLSNFSGKQQNQHPKMAPVSRISSGRSSASSAKQLYMSKSRYMPGKNPVGSASKENNNAWNKPGFAGGLNINRANGGPVFNANSNYVPSFAGGGAGAGGAGGGTGGGAGSTNKPTYRAGGWKRAEPAPLSLNKPSANRQPVGATGRTDWASKYLK